MLLSVVKDAYLNNYNTLCTKISFKLFYSLFIVLFFFQQSLRAALNFRLRKYGSRPLSKWRALDAHKAYFLAVECLKSRLGKLATKFVDGRYTRFLIGKKPSLYPGFLVGGSFSEKVDLFKWSVLQIWHASHASSGGIPPRKFFKIRCLKIEFGDNFSQ